MTPERWHRIRDLLADAIRLPAKDRPQYVAKVCGGDSALRAELESLIAAHEIAEGGTFEKPAFDMTAAVPVVDWNRAKELFEAALELDSSQRASSLAENCPDDDLRQQVGKLLVSYREAGNFLDDPVLKPRIVPAPNAPLESQSEQASRLHRESIGLLTTATSVGADDPMVGRQLGDYRLVRRIGQGGMAAVFLAVRADDDYRKEVAIKLVQPGLDTQEQLSRFRNERQTLADLDHPNIVKLLDGGSTTDGLPFLVMDYVEGSPIDEYCDRHKLHIDERLHLFCRVCEAVE